MAEMIMSLGRKLHAESLQAQEGGEFQKALEMTDAALIAYQRDDDDLGFSEIQAMRFLVLRHLFEKTEDQRFLVLAKFAAMGSVELAEKSGDPQTLAIPLFNLAKVQETLGEFSEGVVTYRKAIENMANAPEMYKNREAILNDMKVHMEVCVYKGGGESGLDRAEVALTQLTESVETDTYSKNVWVSGGHMKIAEAVYMKDKLRAQKHLDEAKKVIDSDSRLVLRKEQWNKLRDIMAV